MLDHGLEIVAYALKLRQSHLLPTGVTPEAQAAQAEAWTAGTAYAALLHDIGKTAVDLHIPVRGKACAAPSGLHASAWHRRAVTRAADSNTYTALPTAPRTHPTRPPLTVESLCHSVRADATRPHYTKNCRPGDSTACSGGLGGGLENKNAPEGASLLVFWRTGRDSNPRWDIIPNTLSRRAT